MSTLYDIPLKSLTGEDTTLRAYEGKVLLIVNVASAGALYPAQLIGAYNISKAALAHITRQLALEMAPGVRVNAVAPSVVRTRLSRVLWDGIEDHTAAAHPLGRIGEPEDVAAAIAFLASEQASWITGVVLPVDGGATGASPPAGLAQAGS